MFTCRLTGRRVEGLTLLETLLALMVLAVLTAATMMAVAGLSEGNRAEAGRALFESLLFTVRTQAIEQACTMRLEVDEQGGLVVFWQPRPFEQPDRFVPCTAGPVGRLIRQLQRQQVRIGRLAVAGQEGSAITFRPDGRSDDARISLQVARPDGQERAVEIAWDGLFGRAARPTAGDAELEEP